jgi:hypothetical protein
MISTAVERYDTATNVTDRDGQDLLYRHVVGDMYSRWVLDCIVEIAYAVSKDFIARPEFYKGVVPAGITDLRMAYGNARGLPSRSQRQEMNAPIFGASDGYPSDSANDKFRALRKPLFDACVVYLTRTVADATTPLQESVISALELFQFRLKTFDGVSIRRSNDQISSIFELSSDVLRSDGVLRVFSGVQPSPPVSWPLNSNDSNGSLLIRAIGEKLQLAPEHTFNEEKFQRLRRVAQQGRIALNSILKEEANGEPHFHQLVNDVYAWAISLRDYWGR